MVRYALLIFIVIPILAGSCAGRKNKAAHRDIIPEKDLISILTEVHIADGLLSLPEVNHLFAGRDTLSSYIDIMEKYGYSKEAMDRTMRYYFIKKPKKLIRIYDKVLGALSEMESRIDTEMPGMKSDEINLWPGRPAYSSPDNSEKGTAWFDFPVTFPGTYTLRFDLTLYPDDHTIDPHPGIFYCVPDTAGNCPEKYLSEFPYLKDGRSHTFTFKMTVAIDSPVQLRGWFINLENQSPHLENHFSVDNILLIRRPAI